MPRLGRFAELHRQSVWRTRSLETQKPATKGGTLWPEQPGITRTRNSEVPRNPVASQAKTHRFRYGQAVCRFSEPSRRAATRKEQPMQSLAYCLPALPGFAGPKTYAALAGMVRQHDRGSPLPAHAEEGRRSQLYHRARDFDRQHPPARPATAEPWVTPPCRCCTR